MPINDNTYISKIQLVDQTVAFLKDQEARASLTSLITSLKGAAYRDVAESISAGDGKIADAATVKTYVDAQIEAINKFEIVVCNAVASEIPAGATYKAGSTVITGTLAAASTTMYKLYFVRNDDAGAGAYVEWITIRTGTSPDFSYSWEAIGSTSIDLSGYVKKTQKIAGITLESDISTQSLQNALGLENLTYANFASGTVAGQTISGVTASYTPAGDVSVALSGNTFDHIKTVGSQASYTQGSFTPASLTYASSEAFAKDGYVPSVSSGTLIFTQASTGTASVISDFSGGSHANDSFTPNTLPTTESQTVSVSSAGFTGTPGTAAVGDITVASKFVKVTPSVE